MQLNDVGAMVVDWFPGREIRGVERLLGGDVNDVYRVDFAVGPSNIGPLVLRIYAAETTPEMVRWERELIQRLAESVPEAVTPLVTSNGATFIEHGGRVVSLWPFVEGRRADRLVEADRAAAARMLGRLHSASFALEPLDARPGYPPRAQVDWLEHRLWSWSSVDRSAVGARVDLDQFERTLDELPAAVRELDGSALPAMPLHGDYGADNLLIADGQVVAVLDWDWCRVDWRAWEVSNAIWAFCRDGSRTAVDRGAAAKFLEAYERAGGEVLRAERAAFGLLMRAARLWEALYVLGEIQRGLAADWDYFQQNVAAIAGLEELDLG